MLRQSSIFLLVSPKKVPSLIAMLSNKASALNQNQNQQQHLHQQSNTMSSAKRSNQNQQLFPIEQSTRTSSPTTTIEPADDSSGNRLSELSHGSRTPPSAASSSSENPAAVLSQLSVFRSQFSQAEIERRDQIEKWIDVLASIELQLADQRQFSTSSAATLRGDDEEDQIGKHRAMLLRAKYNIARKLHRAQIASAVQRKLLMKVARYLRSETVRGALKEIAGYSTSSSPSSSSSSSSTSRGNSSQILCEFVSAVGFFSGAVRAVQRNLIAREVKNERKAGERKRDIGSSCSSSFPVQQERFRLIEKQLGGISLLNSSMKKEISKAIVGQIHLSVQGTNGKALSPQQAISLLFSSTKSGLLFVSRNHKNNNNNSNNNNNNNGRKRNVVDGSSSAEQLLRTVTTSFHPAMFSAWDTLQLTAWLTAMMTRIAAASTTTTTSSGTQQQQQHQFVSLVPLLFKLYKEVLLQHLWIQNASGLRGISAWFVLSCIPQLDEAFQVVLDRRSSSSSSSVSYVLQETEKLKNKVIATLIPECTKSLNSPVTSSSFVEPWNRRNNESGDRANNRSKMGRKFGDGTDKKRFRYSSKSRVLNLLYSLDDDTLFGVKPARVDAIERELSFKFKDPKRLISILSLINSASMRKLSIAAAHEEKNRQKRNAKSLIPTSSIRRSEDVMTLHSQLSLARAVVYGSLARSLHRQFFSAGGEIAASSSNVIAKNLDDIGLLLLVASGPAIENSNLDSRVEAASVSNLIDSIFVQMFQLCERIVLNSSGTSDGAAEQNRVARSSSSRPTDDEEQQVNLDDAPIIDEQNVEKSQHDIAVAIVRCLTCLAHLSGRGFLLGKRKYENGTDASSSSSSSSFDTRGGGGGDLPSAKSRILSEFSRSGASSTSIYSTAASSSSSSSSIIASASKKDRRELQMRFTKEQIAGLMFKALIVVPRPSKGRDQQQHFRVHRRRPLIECLGSAQALDALERALHSLGCLTNSRSQEINRIRGGGWDSLRGINSIEGNGQEAEVEEAEPEAEQVTEIASSAHKKTMTAQDALIFLRERQLTRSLKRRSDLTGNNNIF